jgi:hypothetical protein
MRTTELSSALRAFAELATSERAEELRKFASVFDGGAEETVAARVKRLAKGLGLRAGYQSPAGLRDSLAAIAKGLGASKAKQVGDFESIMSLFKACDTSVPIDEFVSQLKEALVASQARPLRRGAQTQPPDTRLAAELADELARAVLDASAFSKVIDRLTDAGSVSTPTLSAIANKFLGKEKHYSGRKTAIDEIVKRHKQDLRAHARGKALERLGV